MNEETFVYYWENKANGMAYIGVHQGLIDDGYICSSKEFLSEYNQCPDNFTREIINFGPDKEMREFEVALLKEMGAAGSNMFYNKMNGWPEFSRAGVQLSEETKRKIGDANIGRKCTEETRRKLSEAHKGNKHSEETRRKMSKANKGFERTGETRRKISETLKGRKRPAFSKEWKKNISKSQKGNKNGLGFKHTEEAKRKMSKAQNRRYGKIQIKRYGKE